MYHEGGSPKLGWLALYKGVGITITGLCPVGSGKGEGRSVGEEGMKIHRAKYSSRGKKYTGRDAKEPGVIGPFGKDNVKLTQFPAEVPTICRGVVTGKVKGGEAASFKGHHTA